MDEFMEDGASELGKLERKMRRISNLLRLSLQDGGVEGCELIFSCENSKITTHC